LFNFGYLPSIEVSDAHNSITVSVRQVSWDVTFISDLGPLPLIVPDDLDLKGTVASMSVAKAAVGAIPPYDGPDYGSRLISDSNSDLSVVIPDLKQGIPPILC
jgi:hypothetical protein